MSLAALLLRELLHRPLGAVLTVLAVAAAVALVNAFVLLARAGERETRRIQRDIGLNVLVLPAAADIDRYWVQGYSEHTLPEEYLGRVSDQEVANRLIPLLRRRVAWRGFEVMLTGIAPEVFQGGRAMAPVFGMRIDPGELVLGGAVAEALELGRGAAVELLGERFTVARVLAPAGTEEDVRVYADLAVVQRLLDLPGRIGEIQALECHCEEDVADPLALLRARLEPLLPGTRVIRRADAADARLRQRRQSERFLALLTPVAVLFCGLSIGALALINVRERRREIGVLRALGHGSGTVAALVLGRAALLGFLGALLGGAAGAGAAHALGPSIFRLAPGAVAADWRLAALGLAAAPLLAAVASLIPTALAVREDPVAALREG